MQKYSFTWLEDDVMYQELRRIAEVWPLNQDLGMILFQVWSAVQRTAPYPHICVLSFDNRPAAVLCGTVWSDRRCFFIQHVAIASHERKSREIRQALIEVAIDYSQDAGFHGWVACVPAEGQESVWRQHGFQCHDDGFTFRRMGYFARL